MQSDKQADKHARITERAHKIWLDEGKVEGKDTEHWHRAEREIAAEDEATTSKGAKKSSAQNGATAGDKAAAEKPARARAKSPETSAAPVATKKSATPAADKTSATTSGGTTGARGRSRATVGSGTA